MIEDISNDNQRDIGDSDESEYDLPDDFSEITQESH